jgi:hypothetical protein
MMRMMKNGQEDQQQQQPEEEAAAFTFYLIFQQGRILMENCVYPKCEREI